MPYLAGYTTPQDFGATGNGVTDDTAAVQAAINFVESSGGGTLLIPPGTYLCTPTASPALTVSSSSVRFLGLGANSSIIKKNGNGTLLSFLGTTSPSTGATHVRYCSLDNVAFTGNGLTGSLLQLYYVDNFYVNSSQFNSNNDLTIDCVEFWDSRFYNMVVVSCSGTVNSTTQPAMWIRNASAASGVGASTGNSNNIHVIGSRFEACSTGALWITQGTSNSSNPNNFKVVSCKFESDAIQGGPLIQTDNTTKNATIDDINIQLGGFAGGYSTAQTAISLGGGNHTLSNSVIGNSGAATISNGVFLHAVGGSTITVTNVIGGYTTAPTTAHIFFDASATGSYSLSGTPTATGTQFGGTPPDLIYSAPRNFLVGSNTALGDNGVGKIQLANVTTAPTTNPTGGGTLYAVNGAPWVRDSGGVVSAAISPSEVSASPTGALGETIPRYAVNSATQAIGATTGTVYMAGLWLPSGLKITNISWVTGSTAAGTPTHWWLGLADNGGVQRAHTADQTTGAIAANTLITKALTATFTTTYTGLYYVLISVTATTNPTASGIAAPTNMNTTSPLLAGVSPSAAQPTPGTDGTTTYTVPSAAGGVPYTYLT